MEQQKIVVLFLVVCFPVIHGDPNDFLAFFELLDSEKQQWVDTHNYYRRQVSNPEAANMKVMTWDDELATFAEGVVRTCAYIHTPLGNRNTATFSTIGENLFTGGTFRHTEMMTIDGITKLWFDEFEHYNYNERSCASGEQCGHYTQVAWANTNKVGCAIGECRRIERGFAPWLVSCNYGPAGNLVNAGGSAHPPYISGEACSQCEAGDTCIEQLCSNDARDNPSSATEASPTSPTTAVITTPIPTTTVTTTISPTTTPAITTTHPTTTAMPTTSTTTVMTTSPTTIEMTTASSTTTVMKTTFPVTTEMKTFTPRTTASSTMTTSASTLVETNSKSSETNLTALATSSSYLTTTSFDTFSTTQSNDSATTSGGSRNVLCSGFRFSILVLLYIIVKI